jgi:hypothetical protein
MRIISGTAVMIRLYYKNVSNLGISYVQPVNCGIRHFQVVCARQYRTYLSSHQTYTVEITFGRPFCRCIFPECNVMVIWLMCSFSFYVKISFSTVHLLPFVIYGPFKFIYMYIAIFHNGSCDLIRLHIKHWLALSYNYRTMVDCIKTYYVMHILTDKFNWQKKCHWQFNYSSVICPSSRIQYD